MKKKLLTALIIILSAMYMAESAFAAEIMDVPQNTNASIVESSDENSQEPEQKTKKTKKFFTKAEKTKKPPKAKKNKKSKQDKNQTAEEQEPTTDVVVDSEIIEYFPERNEFEATGEPKVTFPAQGSVLYADKIVYNHDTNFVKGIGNVKMVREAQTITGDFIQINLNEENAMMSNPVLNHVAIKIRAKNAIVSENKTEAFDGIVTFNEKASYKFISRPVFGFHEPMMDDVIPKNFYFKEKYDNKWRLKAKTIIINSKKDRDTANLKNADIYIKNTKLASAGNMKLYTDKEQKYMETNMLEMGSLRNVGAFVSPGIVLPTPNSSTLKIGPALTYDHEIGVGAIGRFLTDKNRTAFGWGSSKSKFVVRGEQEITDDLSLQYGLNSYMSNWFLGARMPKYGFQFIHHKTYEVEDLGINFSNRYTAGFARDWNSNFSTTKFAWQTMTTKELFSYKNEDAKFATKFGINAQTHAALYGNGDTMGLVRVGPYLKTQYKSWQQHIGYFMGGQAGDSPFYFDKNFYGKSNVVLGESLRISRYLTLMYAATIVLSNDTPNGDMLQENRFYFLIGPDDVKFMIGYDAYRQNASMGLMMNVGAENADVEFNRLILNDPQAIGKHNKTERQKVSAQKKKEEEERRRKLQESNIMDRSVRDYEDYNPNVRMPGGAMLSPSMIRPMTGM